MEPTMTDQGQLTAKEASSVIAEILAAMIGMAGADIIDDLRQLLGELAASRHWDAWYGRDFAVRLTLGNQTADPVLVASLVGIVGGLAQVWPEAALRVAVRETARNDLLWEVLRLVPRGTAEPAASTSEGRA